MSKFPESPGNILIPRLDTFGDIVLLTGFIESLRRIYPEAKITLLVREGYEQLSVLMPTDLKWRTVKLDGGQSFSSYSRIHIEAELSKITSCKWDLVCFTTYNRTWPEVLLAAILPESYRLALGPSLSDDEISLVESYLGRTTSADDLFDRMVAVPERVHETEKYRIFWTEWFSSSMPLLAPTLSRSDSSSRRRFDVNDSDGGYNYFVCMPAGLQNVHIKAWPVDRFAEIICWIHGTYGWTPLVVGHESEKDIINQVVNAAKLKGVESRSWFGRSGELDILAEHIAGAHIYVGNDSAPLHIACAMNTPVIGLYGGGTFPRFLPTGERSVAVAGELPCFGCGWDCLFGDAPCMRLVSVDDVCNAITAVLSGEELPAIWPATKKYTTEVNSLIEKAFNQRDIDRQNINKRNADQLKTIIARFQDELNARFQEELKALEASLDSLKVDLDEREKLIFRLSDMINQLESSLSWRITKPLRRLVDRARSR